MWAGERQRGPHAELARARVCKLSRSSSHAPAGAARGPRRTIRCSTVRLLVADVVVDVEVVLGGLGPGAIDPHPIEREVAEPLGIAVPEADRAGHRGLDRVMVGVFKDVAGTLLGRIGSVVAVGDGVGEPA